MNAKTVSPTSNSFLARPGIWVVSWFAAWMIARMGLEQGTLPTWIRVTLALAPAPLAVAALLTLVRGARELDELEQRIQLEALAIAFVLAMLLLMTLGLMELAVTLDRDNWSYRHVWAMLPVLYFLGLAFARRRYS